MASITIRQLDDDLKQRLRLRAARNGRSMEEEARIILGEAAALQVKLAPPGIKRLRRTATTQRTTRGRGAFWRRAHNALS